MGHSVRSPLASPFQPDWLIGNQTSFRRVNLPFVFRDSGYSILSQTLVELKASMDEEQGTDIRLLISEVGALAFLPNAASRT